MAPFNVLSCEIGGEHSYLMEYYSRCKAGEPLIGRELETLLDTLMEDMQDPEYRFELTEPHKRIRFIETKCKLFEAPFAGKPFLLELFQKAFIEAVYGFQLYDMEWGQWVRRFQQILLVIGRKNGKTPLLAALALAEFFCGETGLKIMCASNDYEQADLCYQAIDSMREESRSLEKVTRKNIRGIYFGNPKQKKKKGKFSRQNKAQIRKMSAKSGAKEGRNLGMVIVDEVFEMKDDSTVMPLIQSLSTQKEPLYFEITTEGFTQDGYLDNRLKYARQVLRGEVEDNRLLPWLYTQDSEKEVWQEEKSWQKSNPGLGSIKRWGYLRSLVAKAKLSKSERAFVLAKEFNLKQNNAQAWLEESVIVNPAAFDLEEFRGCYYLGAADLAETTDLNSVKASFLRPGDHKKYTIQMYFIPEAKADADLFENDTNREKKDYRQWEREGLVTILPGNEVDGEAVAQWFIDLYTQYGMTPYKIGYDNWHAKGFAKTLEEYFGKEVLERVPMDFAALSSPMRSLEADLKTKGIVYNNHEIDAWCLRNTAIRTDNIGRIMPVKVQGRSSNRIDGCLTFIICQYLHQQYGGKLRELIE
ncbi:terminase large subunit [Merdimmobilis hominis]|uniref:terminase large subunit n=1 Tax=Merdimmobilis hominis TaxID=2897707 RepID=UPI0008F8B5DA|nr:terminase TerL endonuclease subunit [Merdimmobilis hominis]DAT08320.1 MAG TPA: Large Terminase [Caudoviricetes sp.]